MDVIRNSLTCVHLQWVLVLRIRWDGDETSACPLQECSNIVWVMMVIADEEVDDEMRHIKLWGIRSNVDFDVTLENPSRVFALG